MATVHRLIEAKGRQGALELGVERRELEAAATYMADEDSGVGFLYSGWCQAALPHRKLPDVEGWQVTSDRVTLVVEPGMRPTASGKPEAVGVPYGSRARLILIYLQSEAIRTKSREINLDSSLRTWLVRLGIPQGGTSIAAVRDQAERLSLCHLTFRVQSGTSTGLINQSIVDTALFMDDEAGRGQFLEKARLSEGFFAQLQKHPVPMEEAAIRAVSNNSLALDIYAWLAYRLHSLPSPRPITWRALKPQFGASFGRLDNFRASFCLNLKLALAVYPAARVEVTENGLTLYPSSPPVSKEKMISA